MSYVGELPGGAKIRVENVAEETRLTLEYNSGSGSQAQGSGFITGRWTLPPALYQLGNQTNVLIVESASGRRFVSMNGTQIQSLSGPPDLADAETIPLQRKASEPAKPITPTQSIDHQLGEMRWETWSCRRPRCASETWSCECQHRQRKATPHNRRPVRRAVAFRFCPHCGAKLADEPASPRSGQF